MTAFLDHLRAGAGDLWTDYTAHDWVRQVGEGTLPRALYVHYLTQDALFLVDYARAWALGAVKAETRADMLACLRSAEALAGDELEHHLGVCAAAGAPDPLAAAPHGQTLAYTAYVQQAALTGDMLDFLCAAAPCVFGYAEIGTALRAQTGGDPDHPYAEWIDTYAGEDYQASAAQTAALIDRVVARRLGAVWRDSPRMARLQEVFDGATRLEAGFWEMALAG